MLSLPVKEFDFPEAELARMRAAVETWGGYGVSPDGSWLESVLAAFATTEPSAHRHK